MVSAQTPSFRLADHPASCRFDNPFAHSRLLGGADEEIIQLSPGVFESDVAHIALPHLHLFRERSARGLLKQFGSRLGSLVFSFPLHFDGPAWLNGHQLAQGQPILCDGNASLEIVTPEKLDLIIIGLDRQWFAQEIHRRGYGRMADHPWGQTEISLPPPAHAQLSQEIVGVLGDAQRGPSPIALENRLVTTIIDSLLAASQLEPRPASARKQLADAARMLCLQDPQASVSLEGAAEVLGISRRYLQTCFQTSFGLSATQLLRAERLSRVRLSLIAAREKQKACSIGDVAATSGFWHWSRFSADYRQMFGELPSQTLRSFSRV